MKCLIAYKTKTGTTQEIAQRVAEVLKKKGVDADVASIDASPDLAGYSRVVLGCPINGMKLMPEMEAYVTQKVVGKKVPVDMFVVSYMYYKGRAMWKKAIDKDVSRIATLASAQNKIVFGGRIAGMLPGVMRFMFGIAKDTPLDQRDWGQIESWASDLAARVAAE
jgi:menaquinone-dependent protoporphyrinogen oxidase